MTSTGHVTLLDQAPATASAVAIVDLKALSQNYQQLQKMANGAQVGAAVKANAYGLGLEPVMQTLLKSGCGHFFVATVEEGIAVRSLTPDADIYILDGLLVGAENHYLTHHLQPVLGSMAELGIWRALEKSKAHKAALHLDTGINRLGLTQAEACELGRGASALDGLNISMVMCHLANGDHQGATTNALQCAIFQELTALPAFKDIPKSMANSAGHSLGRHFTMDLTRPGIALYGGQSQSGQPPLTKRVVSIYARLIAKRQPPKGAKVGYGSHHSVNGLQTIGTVSIGYADGMDRHLSARDDHQTAGFASWHNTQLPYVGRVSMDMITIDISSVANQMQLGDWIEMLGPNVPAEILAARAGTIDYTLFTGMGPRVKRIYVSANG